MITTNNNKCLICGIREKYSYEMPVCYPCKNKIESETKAEAQEEFIRQCNLPSEQQDEYFKILIQGIKDKAVIDTNRLGEIKLAFTTDYYKCKLPRKYRDLRKKHLANTTMPKAINENICPECGAKCKNYTLCLTCYSDLRNQIIEKLKSDNCYSDENFENKLQEKLQYYKKTFPQNYIK